jgi:CelD/BcsL family acetyltransferase involved in cellulose biosynthesis
LGPIAITAASTPEEAQYYLNELKVLHQKYWREKGMPGSFSNPEWEKFHRALINDRFEKGEIQLICICAGDHIIGYLYNFVKYGRVSVLQSGFAYEHSNALHPGYVSHYLAIQYNLERGEVLYDFLAGDARYKESLSDGNSQLVWVVIQKKRIRYLVEDWLRELHGRFKSSKSRLPDRASMSPSAFKLARAGEMLG